MGLILLRGESEAEIGLGFKLYVLLWLVGVVCLIWFWFDLPPYIKWPLSIIEALGAPDLESVKALFSKQKKSIKGDGCNQSKRKGVRDN